MKLHLFFLKINKDINKNKEEVITLEYPYGDPWIISITPENSHKTKNRTVNNLIDILF